MASMKAKRVLSSDRNPPQPRITSTRAPDPGNKYGEIMADHAHPGVYPFRRKRDFHP
jgi:hypothetical protein